MLASYIHFPEKKRRHHYTCDDAFGSNPTNGSSNTKSLVSWIKAEIIASFCYKTLRIVLNSLCPILIPDSKQKYFTKNSLHSLTLLLIKVINVDNKGKYSII